MYHAESISAESKLKEAEKQEEKQIGRSGDPVFHIRLEERHQRRSSVKKIEKMKEKVKKNMLQGLCLLTGGDSTKKTDTELIEARCKLLGIDVRFLPREWKVFKKHKNHVITAGHRLVVNAKYSTHNTENLNINEEISLQMGLKPKYIVVIPVAG